MARSIPKKLTDAEYNFLESMPEDNVLIKTQARNLILEFNRLIKLSDQSVSSWGEDTVVQMRNSIRKAAIRYIKEWTEPEY